MLKYVPEMTSVVLEEIPDRLTLAVEVSNCRGNCPGCHSPFLREDVGEELTAEVIDRLVGDNFGVNCFLFLGEGRDPAALLALAAHVRSLGLAVALYSGREDLEDALWEAFDYVKVGPYRAECGPLNARTTNQRLYRALAEGEEAISSIRLRAAKAVDRPGKITYLCRVRMTLEHEKILSLPAGRGVRPFCVLSRG